MARHVLFVDALANSAVEAALSGGWRITRVEEGQLALSWLRRNPPDLILLGLCPAGLTAPAFARAVKVDHPVSLLPLVQLEGSPPDGVCAEPDAWLNPTTPQRVTDAIEQALAARAERQRDGARADLRLSLPSDLDHLEEVAALFGPWFAACGFGPQLTQQLTLAVRELIANSIEWGHRLDRSLPVEVLARLDDEKVSVLVRDTGPGFDPCDVPHAARPGDPLSHLAVRSSLQLREGGFGILMTRGMVDHLCYNESGNEAQLTKYLPSRRQHLRPVISHP
jgi:two-component system, OmpR family, response regulator